MAARDVERMATSTRVTVVEGDEFQEVGYGTEDNDGVERSTSK